MDRSRGRGPTERVSSDLVTHSRRVDASVFDTILHNADAPLAYWEAPDESRILGAGSARVIKASGRDRFERLTRKVTAVCNRLTHDGPPGARPRMVCGAAFMPGAIDERWRGFAPAWGLLPRHTVLSEDADTWLTTITPHQDNSVARLPSMAPVSSAQPPGIVENRPIPACSAWKQHATTIRDRIRDGPLEKVVLAHARDVTFSRPIDRVTLVDRLREENPDCYIVLVEPKPGTTFLAATPERLISKRGTTIRTDALAGSTCRGRDTPEDDRLAAALRTSTKNGREHALVVDAITDTLDGIGASVHIGERQISRFESVQHLKTPIRATYDGSASVLSFVDRLHPTPAVGGTPCDRATATIQEIEPFGRGWYAAPIGWIDRGGDGTFAIGIRSGVLHGGGGRLFAGAGIVAQSDVAEEWEECQLKYQPMLAALDGS